MESKNSVQLIPHLIVDDGKAAIDFYTRAFGATEFHRMLCPKTGKLMHAELHLGNSKLFLCDAFPEMGAQGPKGSGRFSRHNAPLCRRCRCLVRPRRPGGCNRLDAALRHVLGRPLRQDHRPLRPPVVACHAQGAAHPRSDAGTHGRDGHVLTRTEGGSTDNRRSTHTLRSQSDSSRLKPPSSRSRSSATGAACRPPRPDAGAPAVGWRRSPVGPPCFPESTRGRTGRSGSP